jgi:hypothetical protein
MSRIVDIRHGRIAAVCAQAACEDQFPDMPAYATARDGAEIILFPRLHRSYAGRPRKRVTRRFQPRLVQATPSPRP